MPAGTRAVTRWLIALDGEPDARDVAVSVAGWVLFEEERQTEAHRHDLAAPALARAAGNRDVEALTLLTMSMQRAHVGRFAEALDPADRGRSTTAAERVRAVFALRRARA